MTEKIIYTNYMNTRDLKSLSKSQLIHLLLKQQPHTPPTTHNVF